MKKSFFDLRNETFLWFRLDVYKHLGYFAFFFVENHENANVNALKYSCDRYSCIFSMSLKIT